MAEILRRQTSSGPATRGWLQRRVLVSCALVERRRTCNLRRMIWIAAAGRLARLRRALGSQRRAALRSAAAPALPSACEGAGVADATLLLVGDAGAPRTGPEPLLDALARRGHEAGRCARPRSASSIAFLGETCTRTACARPDHPDRARDEARLLFGAARRRARLRRTRLVRAGQPRLGERRRRRLGGDAACDPLRRRARRAGSAAERMSGSRLRSSGRGWGSSSSTRSGGCTRERSREGDGSAAPRRASGDRGALAWRCGDAGNRHAIVLAHHPLVSGGPHGARFGWQEHFFPFREMNRSRGCRCRCSVRSGRRAHAGVSPQDMPSEAYRRMIESIDAASAPRRRWSSPPATITSCR